MSSYGELIQALGVLKNVKEKRHGIKTLSSLCAQRAFQVRIVQRGGWKTAILPLIISLDDDCRKYAALAIANLSCSVGAHQQLLEEDVLRHLIPILYSEEVQEVLVYVINALGNFACSPIMWQQMHQFKALDAVVSTLRNMEREEIKINALFCIANMTADPAQRHEMLRIKLHEVVWGQINHPNFLIMQYSLAVLRGMAVEPQAQDVLPKIGLVPILIGIMQSQSPHFLKTLALDIFLHLSFLHSNALQLLDPAVIECVLLAARTYTHPEWLQVALAIIANLCESVELHDRITESALFEVLTENIKNDAIVVKQHVIRGLMQLSLSPKYHHIILSTGVLANVCTIAMVKSQSVEMRVNALEMLAAICGTHPSTPTEQDVMDLLFLACDSEESLEVRRSAMLVLANAAADDANKANVLRQPYIESLVITLSKATDIILVDYIMQFFHNICRMDKRSGAMLIRVGYEKHMLMYERLESLSIASAIYLCDTCRVLADDAVVRAKLMEQQVFALILDAWVGYMEQPRLAPHLALMCSNFAYHADTHQEFTLQGGLRIVIGLYSRSQIEHVRLCCLLSLLYLADADFSQRAIAQERGIKMLLTACENESHIDLVTNSLKALIPFASSDDYRPQLGMDGALDTFASYLFSDQLSLQQLGIYLLQNLLEHRFNRRIFLNLAEEKKCEEDYLDAVVRFLPTMVKKGAAKKLKGAKDKQESNLTEHDPFVVRCCIHSLALLSLENVPEVQQRFNSMKVQRLLYHLFYSEQIDKTSGEAILLFFANVLHSSRDIQATFSQGLDLMPLLLSAHEMGFSLHTNLRCVSALLSMSRRPEFRPKMLTHLELIMTSVNVNLSLQDRQEKDETFYATAAVHCALLSELAMSPAEHHDRLVQTGVLEAFLVFITVAARGYKDEISIELLMSAVYGVSVLVASPTCRNSFMTSLLFPATRLQLLLSLLRLPQQDVNATFHLGTVGLRALQRMMEPNLLPEDLHVDFLEMNEFLDVCGVLPSNFIYRCVVRTLCMLLAREDLNRSVMEAIAPQIVVPICRFALQGCTDTFVQVFGYVLVGRFSIERYFQNALVSDAAIVNDILNSCRRFNPSMALDDKPQSPGTIIMGKSQARWTPKEEALNRYLLAMYTLTGIAESVKERYLNDAAPEPTENGKKDALSISNAKYMTNIAASCLRDLDCEKLVSSTNITNVQDFIALLNVVVVHNSLLHSIDLEGKVASITLGPEEIAMGMLYHDANTIPRVLASEFKRLPAMQSKCDGLARLADRCLEDNISPQLVIALLECLGSITYQSSLGLADPQTVFTLMTRCPEWVLGGLSLVFANSLAHSARCDQDELLGEVDSSTLFPLLTAAKAQTRMQMLGALANIGAIPGLFDFITNSGVIRLYRPCPTRGAFLEDFRLHVEMIRLLANTTVRLETHTAVCSEGVAGFLRDALTHCTELLHHEIPGTGKAGAEFMAENHIEVVFGEADVPPLGMRIQWVSPPRVLEVLPNTPASKKAQDRGGLQEGDALLEVNGVDVSMMSQDAITSMFDQRPLQLVFHRGPPEKDGRAEFVETVEHLKTYGTRDQYFECLNLTLHAIHNLATSVLNHANLLAEPRIPNVLLDLIPSAVVTPRQRSLVFSTLTAFCERKDLARLIFHRMKDYVMDVGKADTSLRKYVVLSANLYYTSVDAQHTVPDPSMLVFIGELSSMEGQQAANTALGEILHRMALAPIEQRVSFVSRDTMVMVMQFAEMWQQWDVQVRAFEVAYFLTATAIIPDLWHELEVLPRLCRAASLMAKSAGGDMFELREHEDALWEVCVRTICLCLPHAHLLKQLTIPELDRYLVDLFLHNLRPLSLFKCAGFLMSGFLQSGVATSSWTRWKRIGILEKLTAWLTSYCERLRDAGAMRGSDCTMTDVGRDLDAILHMLLHALPYDMSVVQMLATDEAVTCVSKRVREHVSYFRLHNTLLTQGNHNVDLIEAIDIAGTNAAFRTVGQLLSGMASSKMGLEAVTRMQLVPPLAQLFELPAESYRIPCLVALCVVAGHEDGCAALLENDNFKKHLRGIQDQLSTPGSPLSHEELEYIACIMDRCCCHQDLVKVVHEKWFDLLCLLVVNVETINAQVMTLRAMCQCAFSNPMVMEGISMNGSNALDFLLALAAGLRSEAGRQVADKGMIAVFRRNMISTITQRSKEHPPEAKLAAHFTRALLCEGFSISRLLCQAALPEMDFETMLEDLSGGFQQAEALLKSGSGKLDILAAELLNRVCSTLHTFLCISFRQQDGKIGEEALKEVCVTLSKLFSSMCDWLCVSEIAATDKQEDEGRWDLAIARLILKDVRCLHLLSAVLREVCAKPLDSPFLTIARSRPFYDLLDATVGMARSRFALVSQGMLPRDLFTGKTAAGTRLSPLAKHIEELDMGSIFEHLLVCVRHTLVQAMFIPVAAADVRTDGRTSEPWCWGAQEYHRIHAECVTWLPEVVRRYPSTSTEAIRYAAAGASFNAAEAAAPPTDEPPPAVVANFFSLSNGPMMEMFVNVLNTSEDPCTECLASLAASNLVEYLRQDLAQHAASVQMDFKSEQLLPLALASIRTLQRAPSYPRDLQVTGAMHPLRTLVSMFGISHANLTCKLLGHGMLPLLDKVLEDFYHDVLKIETDEDFALLLHLVVGVVRGWILAGCRAELELEVNLQRQESFELRTNTTMLEDGLAAIPVMNFLTKLAIKLVDSPRVLQKVDDLMHGIFVDILVCMRSVLQRADSRRSSAAAGMAWDQLNQEKFELTLASIHKHRLKRSGVHEDKDMVNILYLMTKQDFLYSLVYFPDYLMQVAYGERQELTREQDIAAVCCAIISTQANRGKNSAAPRLQISNVVTDCGAFVEMCARVEDPLMRLWHFRIITQWSQKPRVLDEISKNERALRYVVGTLVAEPTMARYAVVIVHNLSVLRPLQVLKAGGLIAEICGGYEALEGERLFAGAEGDIEPQRRMFRRLLIASIRNCLLSSEDLDADLQDGDWSSIVKLVDAVEPVDVSLYLTSLLHVIERTASTRAFSSVASHPPLVKLLVDCIVDLSAGYRDCTPESTLSQKEELYCIAIHDGTADEEPAVQDLGSTTQTNRPVTGSLSSSAGTGRGLGKKPSLYQRSRMNKRDGAGTTTSHFLPRNASATQGNVPAQSRRSVEQEFVYFAAVEILVSSTFREPEEDAVVQCQASVPIAPAVIDSITGAFSATMVKSWLQALRSAVDLHENRRLVLTDIFVEVSAKLLWHCWSHPLFKEYFDTAANISALAKLMPFFLGWESGDVEMFISDVCLHSRLHQNPSVCEYVANHYKRFPDLSCALLSHAFADEEASFTVRQAEHFLRVFCQLLEGRLLSNPGLIRVAVSFELALLLDHPGGLAVTMVQKYHGLLADLLDLLAAQSDARTVKQSMAVALSLTVGLHYKPIPELDLLVLRVLDMAAPLLESEFALFLPVFYHLAAAGGKRVQGPMLSKQLHFRVARLLEGCVTAFERSPASQTGSVSENARLEDASPVAAQSRPLGPRMSPQQRMQWCLALFTAITGDGWSQQAPSEDSQAQVPEVQLQAFICVDLLPVLVRVMKVAQHRFEALCALFLVSFVSSSPTVVPHMPAILACSERAFPQLWKIAHESEGQGQEGDTWHLTPPLPERTALAVRRNFVHMLAQASYLPKANPALMGSESVLAFVAELVHDRETFTDPTAPLHAMLTIFAHLCSRKHDHEDLIALGLLQHLKTAEPHLGNELSRVPTELHIIWMHVVISLANLSGEMLVEKSLGLECVSTAIGFAEKMLKSVRDMKSPALALEGIRAFSIAMVPLTKLHLPTFEQYSRFLLAFLCSAPLMHLRLLAADQAVEVLSKGLQANVLGAVLVHSPALESFQRTICGPMDDLAIRCCRVLVSMVRACNYAVHVHLLQIMTSVSSMIADTGCSPMRVQWLAELFMVLTSQRTIEVLDAALEVPDMTPFLGLARATQPRRQEIVTQWLESFGSSLYDVDDVMQSFQVSTTCGFFHMGTRCKLEKRLAEEYRRVLFGAVHKRVAVWQGSVFGVAAYMKETLILEMVPMCELQPDLIASVVAMFHSFLTTNNQEVLGRLRQGGMFEWLCKTLSHKSREQQLELQARESAVNKGWPDHTDLVATQGMSLRLVWYLYRTYNSTLAQLAVQSKCIAKHWQEYITYHCHHEWPKSTREVVMVIESSNILAMQFMAQLVNDVDIAAKRDLLGQNVLGICLTALLPNPENQERLHQALDATAKEEELFAAESEQAEATASKWRPRVPEEYHDDMDSKGLLTMKMPFVKLLAGETVARLTWVREAYEHIKEKRFAEQSCAIFSLLYSWWGLLFEHQGSISVVLTVGLLERMATLFLCLTSAVHVEWMIHHLGLARMNVLRLMFVDFWRCHSNPLLQHHSLRLFVTAFQVHPLYIAVFSQESEARAVIEGVHRTMGRWDVRELRQVIRLLAATLAHTLEISTVSQGLEGLIASAMKQSETAALRRVQLEGGRLRADMEASRSLLLDTWFTQLWQWCDQPGDDYGRAWTCWILLTLLRNRVKQRETPQSGSAAQNTASLFTESESTTSSSTPNSILVFSSEVNKKQISRRAQLAAEQQQAQIEPGRDDGKSSRNEALSVAPLCRIDWLRDSPQRNACLARIAGTAMLQKGSYFAMQMACATSAACLAELPEFLETATHTLTGDGIMQALSQASKSLQLSALLLCVVLSSLELPLKAQFCVDDFLNKFHELQRAVIIGISSSGLGPYDQVARWLLHSQDSLPLERDFRCMVAFMIGQCVYPPLATTPSLAVNEALLPAGKTSAGSRGTGGFLGIASSTATATAASESGGPPPVAVCSKPPEVLLESLAQETLKEDRRLGKVAFGRRAPIFSTMLCHLLYSLAAMVPLHARAAANSSSVRGAAFSQLMKIQSVVAMGITAPSLYDPMDGARSKLYLYIRAAACLRAALQCVVGSWFAEGGSTQFSVKEQGAKDFMHYCVKHIIQAYNNKTVLTRVIGTPWERMMLSQGPTATVAELLLTACTSEENLVEMDKLGGQHALHSLSKYGETAQVRQQATMLLTKLAVLTTPAG